MWLLFVISVVLLLMAAKTARSFMVSLHAEKV